ncbi:hypothetical protein BSKO_09360 [Bryopsis sp. KO-2023]|nr:hypothetical protein BSKO_09360 [Bryopsis sp. KO-2023]
MSIPTVILLIVLSAPCAMCILNEKGIEFFKQLLPTEDTLHSGDRSDGWRVGRGTFYGNEPWLWSIHEGSCGYGYIWEDEPLGWDVAALPDVHYEFAGSCGCCGDMDHFDLSVWAFEKLADAKWGVIGLKYRPVSCDYVPPNPASPIANPTPGESPTKPRPWWLPKAGQSPASDAPVENPIQPSQSAPVSVYSGGLQDSWWEKSWNSQRVFGWKGPSGGDAFCSEVDRYGALALGAKGSDFDNHVSLEMWIRTADGIPEVKLQLSGAKGECGMVSLKDLQPAGESNGYSRYTIYLGLFDFGAHHARITAFASEFRGCGGNSAADVQDLFIRNDQGRKQFICVDNVQLI